MKLPDRNEKYQQILLYVLLGAFSILVMFFLLLNILVIVPKGMNLISTFFSLISPFIVGLAIVYLLNPIVNCIEKMLYKSFGIVLKSKKDKLSFSKIIENKTPKTGSNARNIPLLFVSVSDNPLFQAQFANKPQPIPK